MKNFGAIKKMISLNKLFYPIFFGIVMSGCTIEPIQSDRDDSIKGAPDWVNKGSMVVNRDGVRIFVGVGSARPQGDLALQKSVADDSSMTEVATTLSAYLDVISKDFIASDRSGDNGVNDDRSSRQARDEILRQIEENSAKHINDSVKQQIDNAITRQFKDTISKQLKEDISRQIRKESFRTINEAIGYQIDFSLKIEEIIHEAIKDLVSHQVKSITKPSMTGAKIIANWRDPNTNKIWSISELEMKHVKNVMDGAGDLNLNLKKYFETNADPIFDRMIDEKSNPSFNPFSFK